jgi:hypothetical protein
LAIFVYENKQMLGVRLKNSFLMALFLLLSIKTFANERLNNYVQLAFKNIDVNSLVDLRQKVQKSQLELQNLSNPVEIRGGLGETTVGGFEGNYDEIEVSYEIELSGQKRRFKSDVLPILKMISKYDTTKEVNDIKFSILKMLVLYGINNEKYLYAKQRRTRLEKLGFFLKNNKLNSPQSMANKNLIRLKIEEIEYELYVLKLELEAMRSVITSVFPGQSFLSQQTLSPRYDKFVGLHDKVESLPSNLEKYYDIKLSAIKEQDEISKHSWMPDLIVYAGQNNQDQLGARPQHTRYVGVGVKIPTDFSYSKIKSLRDSELKIAKIQQKRQKIKAQNDLNLIRTSILKKIHYIKLNNKTSLAKKEKELTVHFKNLSKGLITLQTYLDLNASIYERFHNSLEYKKELLGDLNQLLNIKKQPIDILGELL